MGTGDYAGATANGAPIRTLQGITTADLPLMEAKVKTLGFKVVTVAESDRRKSIGRGGKGLEVEVTDDAGRVVGNRAAPTFSARAVFTVAER